MSPIWPNIQKVPLALHVELFSKVPQAALVKLSELDGPATNPERPWRGGDYFVIPPAGPPVSHGELAMRPNNCTCGACAFFWSCRGPGSKNGPTFV